MTKLGLTLPAAAAAALLGLAGCGGGCGEAPRQRSGPAPAAQQGPGPGGSGSAPAPQVSRFDSAPRDLSAESAKSQAGDLAPSRRGGRDGASASRPAVSASTAAARYGIQSVSLADLPRILRDSTRDSLVFETAAGCADCRLAAPAVRRAARDFAARYDVLSVDMSGAVDASTPLPILMLYHGAAQTSRQVGMPFPREKRVDGEEDDGSYQRRFDRWLRGALGQGNLKFAAR